MNRYEFIGRRPINIGVIAGDLWMAHDRRTTAPHVGAEEQHAR